MDNQSPPESDTAIETEVAQAQRRLLELELVKIRNEASAARLEARAAEIEIMLYELGSVNTSPESATGHLFKATSGGTPENRTLASIETWDQLRQVIDGEGQRPQPDVGLESSSPIAAPETTVDSPTDEFNSAVFIETDTHHSDDEQVARRVARPAVLDQPATLSIDEGTERTDAARARPAAWLLSAVVHAAIVIGLATIGLQTHRPRDQVALSGSTAVPNEVSMESFEFESSEPETEPTESSPSEMEYDLSPMGEVAAKSLIADTPPAPPLPSAASLTSSATTSQMRSLQTDSDAKIQFCGVEGGGNHFVYLVDSSRSMEDAFRSARRQLLESVEALKPNQRFYVIFYDREPDYMRISDPTRDEPRSVQATPENKAAAARWAMQIKMDRGWAPYDPVKFALELKPDAIFLLSDGDFPQKFEDVLAEANRQENLFGDDGPICIIHTISYHSDEGASRMRRIAEAHGGQYRHVPK